MQQDYRKTIEKQHAPEHLIQKTVLQMQAEKERGKRPLPVKRLAAVAACLAVVVTASVIGSRMGETVSFYQIEENSKGQLSFGLIQMNKQVWSLKEFAANVGWNVENLISDADIQVTEEQDDSISIKATFTYDIEKENAVVEMVQSEKISASQYTGGRSTTIGEREVYFAKDEAQWYAFYQKEEKVLISAPRTMDQDDFVKMIKNILR